MRMTSVTGGVGGAVLVHVLVLAVAAAAVGTSPASAEESEGSRPDRTLSGGPLSLSLEEAIEIALEESRPIAIADAQEEAARARLAQAWAAFLPSVKGSASYTKLDEIPYMDASGFGSMFEPLMAPFEYLVDQGYLDPSTLEGLQGGGADRIYVGDDDIYSIGLSVQQPLFTGGAILNAYGASKHGLRAAELRGRRVEDQTRFDVTQAYVGLVRVRAAVGVMERAVEQVGGHVADLEALFEEGMVLESDVMRARVQLSDVELRKNAAEHIVQLAAAALAFTMGLDPGTDIEPLDDLATSDFPDFTLESRIGGALENRPDLSAMSEAVDAAGNVVGMARSEFFPQLVFVGNYNWDRPNRQYEPEFYDHWSATIALQMNVFDWGGRWSRIKEAKAGRLQAEHGLAMMEDAVRLEVKKSHLEHDEAVTAVVISEYGLAQARESLRVTRESFQSGAATNSDVLDAQSELVTAEMNRISAIARARLAEARIELATGLVN